MAYVSSPPTYSETKIIWDYKTWQCEHIYVWGMWIGMNRHIRRRSPPHFLFRRLKSKTLNRESLGEKKHKEFLVSRLNSCGEKGVFIRDLLTVLLKPPFSFSANPSLKSGRLLKFPPLMSLKALLYCSMVLVTSFWLSWIIDSLLRA